MSEHDDFPPSPQECERHYLGSEATSRARVESDLECSEGASCGNLLVVDTLLQRIETLETALREIRMTAARGASFGHQATPQTPERMAERKDEALRRVIDLCATVGVEGSVLRDAALAGEEVKRGS